VTLSGKCEFIFIFSSCRVLYFLHATMIIPSNQRLPWHSELELISAPFVGKKY
jgi:hypothetical protein